MQFCHKIFTMCVYFEKFAYAIYNLFTELYSNGTFGSAVFDDCLLYREMVMKTRTARWTLTVTMMMMQATRSTRGPVRPGSGSPQCLKAASQVCIIVIDAPTSCLDLFFIPFPFCRGAVGNLSLRCTATFAIFPLLCECSPLLAVSPHFSDFSTVLTRHQI